MFTRWRASEPNAKRPASARRGKPTYTLGPMAVWNPNSVGSPVTVPTNKNVLFPIRRLSPTSASNWIRTAGSATATAAPCILPQTPGGSVARGP